MARSCRYLFAAVLMLAPAAARATQDFTVINRTGYPIDHVYVSHTSDRQWGEQAMTRLDDGARASIALPDHRLQCQYDLRVEYHDGLKATWSGLDLCSTSRVALFWNNKTRTTTAEAY